MLGKLILSNEYIISGNFEFTRSKGRNSANMQFIISTTARWGNQNIAIFTNTQCGVYLEFSVYHRIYPINVERAKLG